MLKYEIKDILLITYLKKLIAKNFVLTKEIIFLINFLYRY